MCETAIQAGISGLAFTDHIDTEKQEILNSPAARKEYVAAIDQLKKFYGDILTILCGYELSEPHKNRQFGLGLEKLVFDYQMVSVHHCDPHIPLGSEEEYIASYLREI